MNYKLKTLGLTLIAALALTAVASSPAWAQFTSSSTHTIITGTQIGTHVISAGPGFGGISCASIEYNGTTSSTNSSDLTLTPFFFGCSDSFGRAVDIDNTFLTYTFTRTGTSGGTPIGTVHLSGAMTLTVTSGGSVICTLHFTIPQTDNGLTYHNLGGTNGLQFTQATTNLKSTTTGSFFNCGIFEGKHLEGTYNGNTLVRGKDTSGNSVELAVD